MGGMGKINGSDVKQYVRFNRVECYHQHNAKKLNHSCFLVNSIVIAQM